MFTRHVGTAGDWRRRRVAGVAWRDTADHSVSTRTGKITPESVDKCRRQLGADLRLRWMVSRMVTEETVVSHRERDIFYCHYYHYLICSFISFVFYLDEK